MINLDSIINENNKKHNEKCPYIPCSPYINLINQQSDIDKIYLYAKDLSEPKYELLIKNRKNAGIKHVNDSNAFIECSNTMDEVYENIDDYNPIKS